MSLPSYRLSAVRRIFATLVASALVSFAAATAAPTPPATMSSTPEFSLVQVPARIAHLDFSYLQPANFQVITLPDEQPNFDEPTTFYPLHVSMANYGAVVISFAARPAYSDGTVQDWAEFLMKNEKLKVISMKSSTLAGMPALIVEALNQTDAGEMRMRTVLMEDGSRLLNLSVMAPEQIWLSVEPMLQTSLTSFRLAEPRGTTTVIMRADVKETTAAVVEEAAAKPAPAEAESPAAADQPTPAADLALASDPATFDPEHPTNARLRDKGVGLTPRLLELHSPEKYAVLGAGAIEATLHVPFGWHVIDDGRRTLVFDAAGKIQISLNLRRGQGDAHALLAEILEQAKKDQPQIDPLLVDFAPDLPGLVLRNYRDGDDVLVQTFVVRQLRDDGLAHVARVTAAPDEMSRAMNLTEIILRSLTIGASAP